MNQLIELLLPQKQKLLVTILTIMICLTKTELGAEVRRGCYQAKEYIPPPPQLSDRPPTMALYLQPSGFLRLFVHSLPRTPSPSGASDAHVSNHLRCGNLGSQS